MQFNFTFIICLLLLSTASFINAQENWEIFRPSDKSFEVSTPYALKSGEKKLLTDVGELHPKTWICEGKKEDDNYLYLIAYVDYPEGTFHKDSTQLINELLNVSMETHVNDLGGNLVYQAESSLDFHSGLIYRVSYNDNKLVAKCRMILVGDRFYSLQVYTLSEKSLNESMNKFFSSFKVNPIK